MCIIYKNKSLNQSYLLTQKFSQYEKINFYRLHFISTH